MTIFLQFLHMPWQHISPSIFAYNSNQSPSSDKIINSLRPSDTIWWHRPGSTAAEAWWHPPLHEPMLTYHQWGLVAFTWDQFYKKCSWTQSALHLPEINFTRNAHELNLHCIYLRSILQEMLMNSICTAFAWEQFYKKCSWTQSALCVGRLCF